MIHLTLCIKNRGLLLPSRRQSTRQKLILGCILLWTWTSAAKVGSCLGLVCFYVLIVTVYPSTAFAVPKKQVCHCSESFVFLFLCTCIHSDFEYFIYSWYYFLLDLEECESFLLELNLLLKSMEVLHRTYSAPAIGALQVTIIANVNLAMKLNVEVF